MTFAEEVKARIDDLAKPPGSLGLLEKQLRQVLLAWGRFEPELQPLHLVFAADNGIVRSGVVQQLAEITYMQARNMVRGTAAISSFCQCNHIQYKVVDVGIDSADAVGIDYKAARGSRDFLVEPAMTETEFDRASQAGRDMVRQAWQEGYNLVSFGEMGIGNTTTSAAVLTAIAPKASTFLVGYGSAKGNVRLWQHKEAVIRQALRQHGPAIQTAADAIRYVGGFDLAALCAAMQECARLRLPFYIDGFITAVALACAVQLYAPTTAFALPSHLSREPGMSVALRLAGIDEYDVPIHARLALGEGTGAVLGVVLLRSMFYAFQHMATLTDINADAVLRHESDEGGTNGNQNR